MVVFSCSDSARVPSVVFWAVWPGGWNSSPGICGRSGCGAHDLFGLLKDAFGRVLVGCSEDLERATKTFKNLKISKNIFIQNLKISFLCSQDFDVLKFQTVSSFFMFNDNLVGVFNSSEKYEFVSWDDFSIPN